MKKFLGGLALGVLLAAPAMAADMRMPVKAPPPAPPPLAYNWSGIYIGGHIGGLWGTKDWFDIDVFPIPLGSHDVSGFLAGGQIGFNWQGPGSNWVIGIEADGSWTNADGEHQPAPLVTLRTRMNWLATVTGRLGYAWDRVLLYAKGGVAFADEEYDFDFPVEALVFSTGEKNRTGWTVGGGIEIALAGNWSAKLEYNFMDFGDKDVNFTNQFGEPVGSARIDQQVHVAKFGINYRFGGFGGPVVARY